MVIDTNLGLSRQTDDRISVLVFYNFRHRERSSFPVNSWVCSGFESDLRTFGPYPV